MRLRHQAVIVLLAAVGALGLSARAFGQAAELPYYAERITRQNVMILLDSSGSMADAGETGTNPRSKVQVVKDTLAGRQVYDTDNKPVYVPHTGSLTGLYSLLDDEVDDRAMVQVFRVDSIGGSPVHYTADDQGDQFAFYSTSAIFKDDTMTDVTAAATNLASYLRLKGKTCIRWVGAFDVDNDWSSAPNRDVYTAVDCSVTTGVHGDMLFYDALKAFFWYWKLGQAMVPPIYIVPVSYQRAQYNVTWPNPLSGKTVKGRCYATKNLANLDSQFKECYLPSTYTGTDYFVYYKDIQDGVSVTQGELAEANKIDFTTWAASRSAVAFCPGATTTAEVWGDKPYSGWTYYNNCSGTCPTPAPIQSPKTDGNTPKLRAIYKKCAVSSTNAIPAQLPPSDTYIQTAMVNGYTIGATRVPGLTKVTGVDKSQPVDGITGPEFKKTTTGTRIDIFLRTKEAISPTSPALTTIDLTTPYYGSFFSPGTPPVPIYYDNMVYSANLGIMDLYKDVNYGLMVYDNNSGCSHDDFPATGSPNYCMGARLLKSLTTYAGFPAYTNLTSDGLNNDVKNYIAYPKNLPAVGSTPIAASLHDAWRYFFNQEMGTRGGPIDTNPTMKYDLEYPNVITGLSNNHIVQGDPFYTSGCRRNFLIFLTDGEQTDAEPFTTYVGAPTGTQVTAAKNLQAQYVRALTNPTGKDAKTFGVKCFFIGFGTVASDANGQAELSAMAAASTIPGDTPNIVTPFNAATPAALQAAFNTIMNQIMLGHYARTAPKISQSMDIILTNYFDIDPNYPLWKGHLLGWQLSTTSSSVPYWTGTSGNDIGNILLAQDPAARHIFTAADASLTYLDFTTANVSTGSALKTAIDPVNLYTVANIQAVVNLMRGTSGAKFSDGVKDVTWRLGPTFHSNPKIMVKPSNFAYQNLPKYIAFQANHASRPPVIFVGTGMGMIHAFSLATGTELFAYVPKPVLKYLPNLWKSLQIYGMDSTPITDDVYGNFGTATGDTSDWRTVLISGMGGGGTDYVAMDVTNTRLTWGSTMVKPLWNFRDGGKLGYTWSVPVTGPIKVLNGTKVLTKTAVFFGGGMSTNPAEDNHGSKFYIVNAVNGSTVYKDWTLNAYNKITSFTSLPDSVSGVFQGGTNQVPGSPILNDADGDGYYDHAYVGDLQGRLWKFDFHDPDTTKWQKCLLYDVTDLSFSAAKGLDSDRRPIWYTPTLVTGENNTLIIYFSTGDVETFEAANDRITINKLHALVDPYPLGGCTSSDTTKNYARKMSDVFSNVSSGTWPIALDAGEKLLSSPIVMAQQIIFKTYSPTVTDYCHPGTVNLYVFDYLTGAAISDVNGDGVINADDRVVETGLSNSDVSVDSYGNVRETSLDPDCLGCSKDIWPGKAFQTYPMSWGEGVDWPGSAP